MSIWPDGRRFAFTVFDDPDAQTLETGGPVYALLADLGFRTTKAVWPIRGTGTPSDRGLTCADDAYRRWVEDLQSRGFEIGLHNGTLAIFIAVEVLGSVTFSVPAAVYSLVMLPLAALWGMYVTRRVRRPVTA